MLSKKGQGQDFRLIAVQFEEVLLHPRLNVCKGGDKGRVSDWDDGFGGR